MTQQQSPSLPVTVLARVFIPFACGYYLSYLFRVVNAVISPDLVRDVGVDAASLGLLTSAYFLTFALVQLPLGVLLDRYGPRRVNAGLLLSAALGAALFGMSESLSGLVVARALIGVGVSSCLMSSMKAFTSWFPLARLATVNGWLLAAGGLGALTASAPVEALLKITDWRMVFHGLAALTLGVSALIFFVVPERDNERSTASFAELMAGFRTVFGSREFWRVSSVNMTTHATFLASQGLWVAPWLRDVAGFDRAQVAMMLLAMAALITIGFPFFGQLSDRLARRGVPPLTLFKTGAVISVLCMMAFTLGVTSIAVGLWLIYAFVSPASTLSYSVLTKRFPMALAGRVNTAVNLLVFVGAFVAQWGMGAIVNLWPADAGRYPLIAYSAAFGACVAAQLCALLPLLLHRERVV